MVHRCIECKRIIDSTKIYCRVCEAKIKRKLISKKENKEKQKDYDFFEKQRYS